VRRALCVLARPHLYDPYWTLHAAAALDYDELRWPDQYQAVQMQPPRTPFAALMRKQPATLAAEVMRLQERVAELERKLERLRPSKKPAAARLLAAHRPSEEQELPLHLPSGLQSVGDGVPLVSPMADSLLESGEAELLKTGEADW
jgi:hypothetical protein